MFHEYISYIFRQQTAFMKMYNILSFTLQPIKLAPWGRILAQINKKFPACYRTQSVISVFIGLYSEPDESNPQPHKIFL
jgi:hypothetical protein